MLDIDTCQFDEEQIKSLTLFIYIYIAKQI